LSKQSTVMAVAHSKLFCFIVHLFDGVLRLRLFFRLVSFRSGFTRRCFDVIRVLFPPVCHLFLPYSVRAFLVVLLTFVYFTHRPFTPFARNDAIWSASRCLVFLFNQYCAFFAISFGFENFAKKDTAALTVFNFHPLHLPFLRLFHCVQKNTGQETG
jgi:hypothetical protein